MVEVEPLASESRDELARKKDWDIRDFFLLEFFQELCEQVPMNMLLAAKAPQVRHSFRARISSVTQILAALAPETSLLRKRSAMLNRNLFAVDISTKSHPRERFDSITLMLPTRKSA